MPHLDEGQLHALLDGAYVLDSPETLRIRAHLAECALCRAQLEQETALRERAAVILRTARPGSEEMPPFTRVLQRADRTPRRMRLPVPTRLAWAASLMIALGAGWITRGMIPGWAAFHSPESVSNPADLSDAPPAAVTPAPAAVTPESGRGTAADGARRSDQVAAEGRAASVAEPPAAPAPAPAPTAPPVELQRAEVARKIAPAGARPADSMSGRAPAAPPSVQTEMLRREAGAAAQSQRGVVGGLADAPQLTWTYPSRAEAERIARRTVLLVPDLEVVSVGVASRAGSWLFRATQRLLDGNTIELLQEPILEVSRTARSNFAERDAAQSRVLSEEASRLDETGASLLTVQKGEVRITARATLSSDSLRALLLRLR